MSHTQSDIRYGRRAAVCTILAIAVPCTLVHAGRSIDEHRSAEAQGEVEIVNVSGKVEVDGWDRNEVEVTGSAGDSVERVDVSSTGNRTSIHVVTRSVRGWGA